MTRSQGINKHSEMDKKLTRLVNGENITGDHQFHDIGI